MALDRESLMVLPSSHKILPSKPVVRVEPIRPMTADELERYLSDFSAEELRQVNELWQTHAARKELILFEANDPQGKYDQTIRL
jgi:hypothetical protein